MKFRTIFFYLFFLCIFTISSFALAADQKSPTEIYLDELHAQGKERVIVSFKDDAVVDPSLVDKYSGKLIRVFTTIKALVCEIPQINIEPLKNEPSVKSVSPDTIVTTQPGPEQRDPQEAKAFIELKKKYLKKIKAALALARSQALEEYRRSLQLYIAERRSLVALRNAAWTKYRRARTAADRQKYLLEIVKYSQLINECTARHKAALEAYKNKRAQARNVYATALSDTEIAVNEEVNATYTGPAEVRWNNLEAGLNSKAAWDRYDSDGAGIKIAIIDTGINYNVEDLGGGIGLGFKCLGGYDFVDSDDDPINPTADEVHGTSVTALAVGAGTKKAVGVAYNASYYALRVFQGPNNPRPTALTSDVMAAIEWASTEPHKADIISMSLGIDDEEQQGNPLWPFIKQEFEAVCNNAYNAGVVLVAASGNKGYNHSSYPAAFANVISVGAHTEEQTIATFVEGGSNGGVDVVTPGKLVYSIHPDNTGWLISGTSYATPHASGLLALELQYAKQQKMQPNNGYLWEVMKHSAKDLGLDPVWQGKGKAWAADTIPAPASPPPPLPWVPRDGSIDSIAAKWPLDYSFVYDNYAYITSQGYPAYYIGTSVYYDVILLNNTTTAGNYPGSIENLDIITTQAYYQSHSEANMPGSPIETFPRQFVPPAALAQGGDTTLSDTYYIPWSTYPGLDRIALDLKFEFSDDTNNRVIGVAYPYASIWCPPEDINNGFPVN